MADRLSDGGTPWGSNPPVNAYATPDERERVAIHAADQLARGLCDEAGFVEALQMLGLHGDAVDMANRHSIQRARAAAACHELARVLELKPKKKSRRRSA